jgi:UDP-2-acetamido-2,6-beta-L-arabino-hexul-4-ose reductase
MKILITGSNGFIGKHVVLALKTLGHTVLVCFNADSAIQVLGDAVQNCDFVFHLERPHEFMHGGM